MAVACGVEVEEEEPCAGGIRSLKILDPERLYESSDGGASHRRSSAVFFPPVSPTLFGGGLEKAHSRSNIHGKFALAASLSACREPSNPLEKTIESWLVGSSSHRLPISHYQAGSGGWAPRSRRRAVPMLTEFQGWPYDHVMLK